MHGPDFGWSYPAGCSGTPYDEDEGCPVCLRGEDDCECPECPGCSVVGEPDCYGKAKHLPDAKLPISGVHDLAALVCASDDTDKAIARRLYKDTTCGISFASDGATISLSGYCEGSDCNLETHTLTYGQFSETQFWAAVGRADQDGIDEWNRTHGCAGCYPDSYAGKPDDWEGDNPVNPDCKDCKGGGQII